MTPTVTPSAFWPLTAPGGAVSVEATGPRSWNPDPVRGPTYRAVHEQIDPTAVEQLFCAILVAIAV